MNAHDQGLQHLSKSQSQRAWAGMRMDFAEISNWQAAGLNSHAAVPGSLLDVVDAMTEPNQASHLIGYLLSTRPWTICMR
ncbi:hypothetical protein [Pseudarthrobacter raffinosi]|uniref:hypothetical protein n=1 Tax=Pseudarthrobacter raffinosi TaxID=2953651 RepID=UPI00208F5AD4|nr:hypothetical protein [Pseudarthrobacter sp. MDT3-9]MCO4253626.1 hypothetical protein [Pseudarthrobacter sp. MDT3-9]